MPHVEMATMTARVPSNVGAHAMFGHTGIAVGGRNEHSPRLQTDHGSVGRNKLWQLFKY